MNPFCSGITLRPASRTDRKPPLHRRPHRLQALLLASLLALALVTASHGGTYTVQPGDSLWRIAQTHNVSVEALRQANRMGDSDVVIVGQVLTIPGTAGAATTTPRPTAPSPPASSGGTGQHVVQNGETLYSIATQYRTTVASLRQLNGLEEDSVLVTGRTLRIPGGSPPAPSTPASPPGPGAVWHEVQRGETLSAIARRYSVTIANLESWNQINRDAPLIAGSRLRVGAADSNPGTAQPAAAASSTPPAAGGSYTVVRGDTLSSIARAHSVRVAEIAAVNQIPPDSMVRIGQTLRLPANAGRPAPPAADSEPAPPAGAPAVAVPAPVTEPAEPAEPVAAAADETEPATPAEPAEPAPGTDSEPAMTAEAGDADSEIATAESPPAAEPAIADDTDPAATTDRLDAYFSYEIQPDQSLAEVADIFFTTETELLRVNPRLQSAGQARAGDRILVPGEGLKRRFASQF